MFGCFDPGKNTDHSHYDLINDIGIYPSSNNVELTTSRMNDTDFRNLVRSLNKEQKQFFNHLLHSVNVSDDQLSLFLSGGAGVGKSWITNALYEAVTKYLHHVLERIQMKQKSLHLLQLAKLLIILEATLFIQHFNYLETEDLITLPLTTTDLIRFNLS